MSGSVRALLADGEVRRASDRCLRLQILGPLRLWRGEIELNPGPRQQHCLLALLLALEGRPVGMNELVDLIWGGYDPPASATNVIQKYVGSLRRLLEPDLAARDGGSYLMRRGNGYVFKADPDVLDLGAFRRLVRGAASQSPDAALDRYVEALKLWRGCAGAGMAGETTASAIFAQLDREFYDACLVAAELAMTLGRPEKVLPPLQLAVSMAPFHEPVHASLITSLAAAGQQAEALSVFQTVRTRLAEELGIDPGPALLAAHHQVLSQTLTTAAAHGGRHEDQMSATSAVRPAQLPPDLPTFVDRADELATLDGLLCGHNAEDGTSPLVVAMDGMGGVGKSTLATHFAHLVARDFGDGQLYLDLRGHEDGGGTPAAEALRALSSSLGAQTADAPQTLDARVGAFRSLTAGKAILVLLDNARDAAQVRPLLPNSAESLVLVTSRQPLIGLAAHDSAYLLHVDPPDMSAARELLRRRLEQSPNRFLADDAATADVLDEIIELCGRLPLALAILAARLSARPRLSLASVAAELRDGARRLAAFSGLRGVSDPRTAFSWSYRQLRSDAARLFRLVSTALTPGISAEACASLSGQPLPVVRGLLDELTEAALLDEDDRGRFSSHVLVKAYAEELLAAEDSDAEQQAAITRLLQHYLHSSYHAGMQLAPRLAPLTPAAAPVGVVAERPGTYDEAMQWFDNHHEVLHAAVRDATEAGFGMIGWQLGIAMLPALQRTGRFADWLDIMQLSLRAAAEAGDVVGEAHAMRGLAGARHSFGADEEALELLTAAQQIFDTHGMPREQAIVQTSFHRVHSGLRQHERALEAIDRALDLYHAAGNQEAAVWTLAARGRSLLEVGAHNEAKHCLDTALALSRTYGRTTEEPEIRISTARYLAHAGHAGEAIEQLQKALKAAADTKDKPNQFQASILLCDALLAVGDVDGACIEWRNACDIMHSMQYGGTRNMRDSIDELGGRLLGTSQFAARTT